MRRLTAAVLAAAAAAITIAGMAGSAASDWAVRAEIAMSGKDQSLDVRRIRILEGLTPGESYRLPPFGVRNNRDVRMSYRVVISADAARPVRLPPRRWLRVLPADFAIDAGQSRAVALQLQLPADAEPGVYGVVLGVRPGGSEGARLTFRIEPVERTGAWLRRSAHLAMRVVPALIATALVAVVLRRRQPGVTPYRRRVRPRPRP